MSLTDKEIALKIVDILEDQVLQNVASEIAFEYLKVSGWQEFRQAFLEKPGPRKQVRSRLLVLREAVLDAPDLTSAVREIVEGFPKIDPEGLK